MTAETHLQEMQTRLTGGYQLLQALVGIRLRSVADPESRRHLAWLSDIVAAMSLMTRRMADSGQVDFSGYLDDARAFWLRAVAGRPIRIEVRAGRVLVADSQALPLAIIVHELVGNALRHAFDNDRLGTLAVACTLASDGISLVVRDSGAGVATVAAGDGLALVQGLVDHLGGVVSFETAPGAGFGARVRLPIVPGLTH